MTPATPRDHPTGAPTQWTVGQLRAELVGLPDDTPLVVDVPTSTGGSRRYTITSAGYGEGIDPSDGIFTGQEFPLTAGPTHDGGNQGACAWPEPDRPTITPPADD